VAFYFRQYPLPMHKMAEPAHRAALAAHKQGKFWEMHDILFASRDKRSDERLQGIAGRSASTSVVGEGLRDPATAKQVKDDMAECSARSRSAARPAS
jgi:protein-disulfide isomerase